MKKKPAILLIVISPILMLGWLGLVVGAQFAYAHVHGILPSQIPHVNGLLLSLPVVFLWIPLALLVSNLILFVIPPLRRIAEQSDRERFNFGFAGAQRHLLIIAAMAAVFCIPLIVLGFCL